MVVKSYREKDEEFTLKKQRKKPSKQISQKAEEKILEELEIDKGLLENQDIPIHSYNYTSIRDTLIKKYGITVSVPTIINRAKNNGFYLEKRERKKAHDREVLTNFVGELIQHDSSIHLFSPYMDRKLKLITSIDDYSRLILHASLVLNETTWMHIDAAKDVILRYGCPHKYYAEQHSIFRFVKERDKHSPWNTYKKFTDDVSPQFKQVLEDCNVGLIYALSPQAKGKVERPYRWIQDRLVRTAARENISDLKNMQKILFDLIRQYNTRWVHSTTKEIPIVRFESALRDGKSLFRPFQLIKKDQTIDDVFCLRTRRRTDAYRRISLDNFEMRVPNGEPREYVDIHIVPDLKTGLASVRFWQKNVFVGEQEVKNEDLIKVHF